jgi:DNA-binding GntR family transcriptional regulator
MEAQLFDRIQPRTLRAEIVDVLRDAIVSGKLESSEHLKESVIAEQMSVSRIPVREAFQQLEQEGLIVSIPNQGSFVKVFDEKDIREIFTLRGALESLACELVLSNDLLQPEDLEHLEGYVDQQREAIDARDFDRLTKLDMDFHEFICRKSESERLLKTWRSLRAQIQVLFHQRFRTYDWIPETVETDHSAIMKALRQGDVQRVAQVHKEINARVAEECIQMTHAMGYENGT